jgi:MraZ protein
LWGSGLIPVGNYVKTFTGQYFYSIDKKGRLTIPLRLREGIDRPVEGYGFVACVGFDGLLYLYTPKAYEQVAPHFDAKAQTNADVRNFMRLTHGLREELEIDSLGRVLIPQGMLRQFGLSGEVAVVGVGDHIEIWRKDQWEAFVREQLAKRDETATRAMGFAGPEAAPQEPPDRTA